MQAHPQCPVCSFFRTYLRKASGIITLRHHSKQPDCTETSWPQERYDFTSWSSLSPLSWCFPWPWIAQVHSTGPMCETEHFSHRCDFYPVRDPASLDSLSAMQLTCVYVFLTNTVHDVRTVNYLGLYISMDSLTLTLASFSQRYLAEAQDDINVLLQQMKNVKC